MENSENYKPKFDPETGLPLTDAVSDEIKSVTQSISDEVAAAGQPIHPEPPFTAVSSQSISEEVAQAGQPVHPDPPFTAVSSDVTEATSAYQTTGSSEAPFTAAQTESTYQSPAQGSSYQAGGQAPYQAQSNPYQSPTGQAPYQAAPTQAPRTSGIQYSNQPSGSPYGVQGGGNLAPTNTLAIVSLVTGIVSVLFIFLSGSVILGVLGVLIGIAAIVTGTMAMKQIKVTPASSSSKGMALAGIICGAIGLVLSLIITIACAACYASIGGLTKDAFNNLDKFSY